MTAADKNEYKYTSYISILCTIYKITWLFYSEAAFHKEVDNLSIPAF